MACALAVSGCGGALEVAAGEYAEHRGPLPVQPGTECLQISPAALAIPPVEVGCVGEALAITVTNACSTEVVVRKIELPSAKQGVHLVSAPAVPSSGLTLPAGASLQLGVKALAVEEGDQEAELVITLGSQAGDANRAWPLEATALPLPVVTETFTAPEGRARANILLVLDNGPLLDPWISSVRTNLKAFAKYNAHARVRGWLAVTTTGGSGDAGRAELVGESLDLEAPALEASFGQLVDALEVRAGSEDPVQVAAEVVEQARPGGSWPVLLDPDVHTMVIIVTGGPDYSPEAATEYFRRLREYTGPRHNWLRFSVSVVAPFKPWSQKPSPCESGIALDDGTLTYLVQHSNGMPESICTPDWSKSLEWLGTHRWWSFGRLILSQTPGLTRGPIELFVGDVPVPPVDPHRDLPVWRYDGVTESVVFEPLYSPEPTQVVSVSYPVACPQ